MTDNNDYTQKLRVSRWRLPEFLNRMCKCSKIIEWEDDEDYIIEEFQRRFKHDDGDNYVITPTHAFHFIRDVEKALLDAAFMKLSSLGILDTVVDENLDIYYTLKGNPLYRKDEEAA